MAVSVYETSLSTGTTTLTASASGFFSGSASVSVVGVSPLALHLYLVPPTVRDHSSARFVVALTDLQGNPARAPTNIPVTVTQSNTTVVSVPSQVIIPAGNISVQAGYNTLATGTTTITVSAQGLASSSTQVTIEPYPLSFSLSLSNPQLQQGQNAVITATVMLNGMGLGGATVKFSSINCAITPSQTVTSQAGVAQATLSSCNPGSAVITATISSPVIGTPLQASGQLQQSTTINVLPPIQKPSPLQTIFTFPYVLILVAVIVISVLGVLIFLRRRNSNFEEM